MIVGVLCESKIKKIEECIKHLPESTYDLLEVRLDYCKSLDISLLERALKYSPLPLIFTLRPKNQGGLFKGTEKERLSLLKELMKLNPSYIDVEYGVNNEWIQSFKKEYPNIKFIYSYHNFQETPGDIEKIIFNMQENIRADYYKISTFARSTLDALRMLNFCKSSGLHKKMILTSMGNLGESSRILAPLFNSGFTYCPVNDISAPGQLKVETLLTTYNFKSLNPQTQLYGLIGDPVEQSIGHLFHNAEMKKLGKNAVYVKWHIQENELSAAIPLLQSLGVSGLSVTMPHKEKIISYLDFPNTLQAVNTIAVKEGAWHGFNTDGLGLFEALKQNIEGKRILVLGAGGAARTIAALCEKKGASITLLNRTLHKNISSLYPIYPLHCLSTARETGYDILINCLPPFVHLPLTTKTFVHDALVIDINYGKKSQLLTQAKLAGCLCMDGLDMFKNQARLQLKLWFLGDPPLL